MKLTIFLKPVITILCIFLFASAAYAGITHELEQVEDNVYVNTTLKLDCEANCPLNLWNIDYRLPEGSELRYVGDSIGEIEEYNIQNNVLEVSSNTGPPREEEYLELHYKINNYSESIFEDLQVYQLSFSGFDGRETTGTVTGDEIISSWIAPGFDTSHTEEIRFSGEGPVSLRLNVGEGDKTEYFEVFGENQDIDLDKAYELALGNVGHPQDYERIPIVFYSSLDYRNDVSEWSAGEYGAGLIRIKESDELKPIVVHETVHSLNHNLLEWDRTDSAWFDEGVATHAEDLTRVSLEGHSRTSELFGDEVRYQDNGYIYTLPPRGDREVLWDYYQSEDNPMKYWAPQKGDREFGYAYSELIIKKYVKNGGEISEIYEKVDPEREVETNEEKWDLYDEHLDLRPCERDSRDAFDECIDEINDHEFGVKSASRSNGGDRLEIEKIEVPERDNFEQVDIFSIILSELELLWTELEALIVEIGESL